MSIRDDIKANMKTEEQILKEKANEEALRKQQIKTIAINNFKTAIIEECQKGVKGNIINGTYELRYPNIKSRNYYIKGYRMGFFKKYTLWQFIIDDSSDDLIRLDAIKQYATEENISVDVSLEYSSVSSNRKLKVDITKLPEVSVTWDGQLKSYSDDEICLMDFYFVVHYSFSI